MSTNKGNWTTKYNNVLLHFKVPKIRAWLSVQKDVGYRF